MSPRPTRSRHHLRTCDLARSHAGGLAVALFIALSVWPTPATAKRSLSLAEAVALAHERHAEMKAAAVDVELAGLDLLSAHLRRVRLTAEVAASEQQMSVSFPSETCASGTQTCGISGRQASARGSAAIEVPIWTGLQITNGIARARLLRDAARSEAHGSARALTLEVATTYWAVRRVELIAEATRQAVRDSEDLHEITRARASAGLVPAVDGLRVQTHKARQDAALAGLDARATEARAQLASAIQLREAIQLTSDPPPPTVLPALETLLSEARESRPELSALRSRLRAQDMAIRSIYGAFSPEVSLKGQIDLQRGDPYLPGSVASAGVFLRWNILDSFNTVQDLRRAKLVQRRLSVSEERAVFDIETEVRTAHARHVGALADRAALVKAQEAAAAAATLIRRRYNGGAALLVEVTQAQAELRQITLALIDSRISLAQTAAAIAAAIGRALVDVSQ
ncbi:MAG TPA: TolC family protein [Polyangia bacterium]